MEPGFRAGCLLSLVRGRTRSHEHEQGFRRSFSDPPSKDPCYNLRRLPQLRGCHRPVAKKGRKRARDVDSAGGRAQSPELSSLEASKNLRLCPPKERNSKWLPYTPTQCKG